MNQSNPLPAHGAVEPIVGRYVHTNIAGETFRIYFEQAGEGIPLVCLHTAGAHASQYRHLMCDPDVTAKFQVTAFDLPWHGKSNPPAKWRDTEYLLTSDFYVQSIMAFCDALQIQHPVILGCSMGGRVVIRLAREYAAQLTAVIGLEGTDQPSPWWDDSWLQSPQFARGDFCADLVSGLLAPQSPTEFRNETLWHYHQSGSNVFKGDMHFFRTDSQYQDDANVIDTTQCPVYLLTGEYDYSCRPDNTRATAARIPGAKVVIMPELGHFPMSENPALFRSHILPIFAEIAAART